MNEQIKINWYRCKVDKAVMAELMKSSDWLGLRQVCLQLGLFLVTGLLSYFAYRQIHANTWHWALPLTLAALALHGTFSSFIGLGGSVHELAHKTPFKTKALNEFFMKLYCFISWDDYVGFRPSHVKHHQVTVHHGYDGEVVLPARMDLSSIPFFLTRFLPNPIQILQAMRGWVQAANGNLDNWGDWMNQMIPKENIKLRREHRRWARIMVFGHLALTLTFILTGNWFLIIPFQFGRFFFGWLGSLCSMPQHIGLMPDVPDFRLCCRTYTCSWLPGFLYWNMQYHIEHHMFPSVPFYNLPKLHELIKDDLPPCTHGLWATWKQLIPIIRRQYKDPDYVFIPKLPGGANGEYANDKVLEMEAARTV